MPSAGRDLTSVVIPVRNGARFLAQAIGSVQAQTHGQTEIIIIDDGSTDATARLAEGLSRVRYVYQPHSGPAAALNHGARLARGRFLAFLSADDRWEPQKLELQHRALGVEPDGKLVFGHVQHFANFASERARRRRRYPPGPVPGYAAGTLLTTVATFRAVGPFDERFRLGEFLDWFDRARQRGLEMIMLRDLVAHRRVHAGNHSTIMLRSQSYLPVLRQCLERRRRLETA